MEQKNIILTEEQEKALVKILKKTPEGIKTKKYTINPDKVLIVKNFLDKNFKKGKISTIGNNGLPYMMPIVAMIDANGDVLKNMYQEQLVELLIDNFQKMFTEEEERKLFMTQVMNDWYNNKIGTFGTLTVNGL